MSLETNSCLRLLTSNTRLTFLSSTPTAPALFEVDVRGKTLKSRKPGSQCWLFHTLGSEQMRNEILISSLKMDPMTPASQGWAAVMRACKCPAQSKGSFNRNCPCRALSLQDSHPLTEECNGTKRELTSSDSSTGFHHWTNSFMTSGGSEKTCISTF